MTSQPLTKATMLRQSTAPASNTWKRQQPIFLTINTQTNLPTSHDMRSTKQSPTIISDKENIPQLRSFHLHLHLNPNQPAYQPRYEINQAVTNDYFRQREYTPTAVFSPPPAPQPSPATKLNFQSSQVAEKKVPMDPSKLNILDFLKILRSRGKKKEPIDRFRQKKQTL